MACLWNGSWHTISAKEKEEIHEAEYVQKSIYNFTVW
jgi:hypothetical protein